MSVWVISSAAINQMSKLIVDCPRRDGCFVAAEFLDCMIVNAMVSILQEFQLRIASH